MNDEGRARGAAPQSAAKQTDPIIARESDDLRDFRAGYQLGYGAAADVEYRRGYDQADAEWTAVLTGCTETFRRPNYAEVQARRVIDHQPCSSKCKACSRCIHSMAYWARGGDYMGAGVSA
jgi:hypothetical protein